MQLDDDDDYEDDLDEYGLDDDIELAKAMLSMSEK